MNAKLNKLELIKLVTKICICEYKTEKEGDKLIDEFEKNVPSQDILRLLHRYGELTPEEIVEKALAHKPFVIHLGGPKGDS